jgi:hypothetical protein
MVLATASGHGEVCLTNGVLFIINIWINSFERSVIKL